MASWDVKSESGAASPATVIIEKADEWGADLIVVGSHGRTALGQFFFGSVSQKVLHEARRSVRVARGRIEEPGTPVRLIIGFDGSKGAEAAVEAVAARNCVALMSPRPNNSFANSWKQVAWSRLSRSGSSYTLINAAIIRSCEKQLSTDQAKRFLG
jgi:hypothetical protein